MKTDLRDFRERTQLRERKQRRPFDIKKEEAKLLKRSRVNIFLLLTEAESARLWQVARQLMEMETNT